MNEIEMIAKDLMKAHGLINWKFAWNNKRTAFGTCRFSNRTIELSSELTPLRPKDETINTILHEIAHALVGANNGHNHIWRRKFIEMGGNGERCSSTENIDMKQVGNGNNWVATCVNGHEHVRFKKPPTKETSCGLCSNKFDRRYILIYERQLKTA